MTNQTERVFKQRILKELATFQTKYQYFQHTKLMARILREKYETWIISNYDYRLMLAAVYGYHCGCHNLFDTQHRHPDLTRIHHWFCFDLAATKLERLMSIQLFKQYSQTEVLIVSEMLLSQSQTRQKPGSMSEKLADLSKKAWSEIPDISRNTKENLLIY